jgi:hypothetical protein
MSVVTPGMAGNGGAGGTNNNGLMGGMGDNGKSNKCWDFSKNAACP